MRDLSLVEPSVSFASYPFSAIQRAFFTYAYHHQRSVAAWRLPHQTQQHIIADLSGSGQSPSLPLELLPAGFMAQPFQTSEKAVFIRADLHYTTGNKKASVRKESDRMAKKALRSIKDQLTSSAPEPSPYAEASTSPGGDTSRAAFVDTVAEAVRAIEEGQFCKVVPSRRKGLPLPSDFDLTVAFQQLCEAYPAAFVSVFSVPGVGTWLGASPEILVSTYQRGGRSMFRTMALAGTQAARGQNALKNASWRQKEIEEQALVSRYIINCFKQIRLREFEENGPKTVAAGNLLHLQTDFTVDTEATNFPDLGSTMLSLLHPTSAVCGMPKEAALAFLRKYESHHRSFFSGYLGPVNVTEETHLFVNLRCMQLLRRQALLYAGAGVTADSEPNKEWKETEIKMDTLRRIILP